MAASSSTSVWDTPEVYKHHEQQPVCHTRPKYREGRRPKAVKVYTINLESRFLMVQGVPAIGAMTELVQLFALYGVIEEYRVLDEYPAEQFTEVYLIKFQRLQSARMAKRNLDERSFFGGLLHVCYAPEHETVEDTRQKLQDRRRYIARSIHNKAKELVKTDEKMRKGDLREYPAQEHRSLLDGCEEVESYNSSALNYPLLRPPPQEGAPGMSESSPAVEDNMGSTYYIPDNSKQTAVEVKPRDSSARIVNTQRKQQTPPAARFLPRTTHLEDRKRRLEEARETLFSGALDGNELVIGPKLPEPPKLDMEDDSLNITANVIRNTMRKVSSVPEHKMPQETATAVKKRRRI